MPHRIRKCTNTLYDYAIIIIKTYVSLMYELNNKFVGTGPSSYEKRIYWAVVSQKVERRWFRSC